MGETPEPVRLAEGTGGTSAELVLPGGVVVRIRPSSRCDLDGLRDMFARLSGETIYQRFHVPYERVPDWAVRHLAAVNEHGGLSLVAAVGGRIVGHAMHAPPEDGEAEFAVVVEDGWQSRGIGRALIRRLALEARRRGVGRFVYASLWENRRLGALISSIFGEVRYAEENGRRLMRVALDAPGAADTERKG